MYGVQCDASNDERTNNFYQTLADKTAGRRVELQQFSNLFDFIMAICYREQGAEFLDKYEMEVRASVMFGALKDGEPSTSSSADKGDKPESRTVPYKPAMKKKPSLTNRTLPYKPAMKKKPSLKCASLTKLKEKSVSVFKAAKSISKRKLSSAVDRKRIKLLAISYQKVNFLMLNFIIFIFRLFSLHLSKGALYLITNKQYQLRCFNISIR